MSGSIKEYLAHQSTEVLKTLLFTFSQKNMIEQYGYAIKFIEEELRKREES